MYTWSFTFPKKTRKLKQTVKISCQKITQLKQSSNFYVISEVELVSVMPVGYVLYYSDVRFLAFFTAIIWMHSIKTYIINW